MLLIDKQKEPFELKKGSRKDTTLLVEMYETFYPKGRYQGLPPANNDACASWLRHIFSIGENFLAFRNGRMIGHAALLPDMILRDGEYLVFVHQHHRGRGVGTQLTRSAMDRARILELRDIWLTVDADNFIAIRLYRNFGFSFCDEKSFHSERKMTLHLEGDGKPC